MVYERRADGRSRDRLLDLRGTVDAIDYGVDGQLAYLLNDGTQQTLYVWQGTGEPRALWTFPAYLGRGLSSDDALRVAFSPDGTRVLVVNTFVDTARERQDETLLVLDLEGRPVVDARNGTHGIWLDTTRVAYLPYAPDEDDVWRALDVTTGEETRMPLDLPASTNPALSPQGTHLAVEDAATGSVVVLDLASGERQTVEGSGPVWFDLDTLLVSEMEACDASRCETEMWRPTGRSVLVDLGEPDGSRRFVPITATLETSVLFENSDHPEGR